MRNIWLKIKSIFIKKHKEEIVNDLKKEKLVYTGNEPDCWACNQAIHQKQRSRRLNGNKIHIVCFRRLKKIMMRGGKLNEF